MNRVFVYHSIPARMFACTHKSLIITSCYITANDVTANNDDYAYFCMGMQHYRLVNNLKVS